MSSSTTETLAALAQDVTITEDALTVELSDGRSISAPLAWYLRLLHGTPEERSNWRLIGGGVGVHWPALDEDVSVENLLIGRTSGESQRSLKRWLEQRVPEASVEPEEQGNAEVQRVHARTSSRIILRTGGVDSGERIGTHGGAQWRTVRGWSRTSAFTGGTSSC